MKVGLIAGHSSRSILNPFPDRGAVLRENGKLITTEHREVKTLVSWASVVLNDKYQGEDILVCPFQYNLNQKIKWANKNFSENDIILSVHLNAGGDKYTQGSEVWYYGGSKKSEEKAEDLCTILSNTIGNTRRGTKPDTSNRYGRLGIIRDTKPWAFLLELGFLASKEDLTKVRQHGSDAIIKCVDYFYHKK